MQYLHFMVKIHNIMNDDLILHDIHHLQSFLFTIISCYTFINISDMFKNA